MKTIVGMIIVSMLMLVAAPVYSGTAVQVFKCQEDENVTEEQLDAVANAWLTAARTMPGGEKMELSIFHPVAAQLGEDDFLFVLEVPSMEEWGKFQDAYPDSVAAKVDVKFGDLADCPDSALWESIKAKAE